MVASADTLFDVLDSAFGSVGEIYFRRFMKNSFADKWMIAADFVIGAPEAVHDVFAITIFPHYEEFTAMLAGISKIFPRDLKRTKIITDEMITFLRDTKRFHFCFLFDKNRYELDSVGTARAAITHAIRVVQKLDTGGLMSSEERRKRYIQLLRGVEDDAKANRFNFRNFFDIHILSVLLATIMLWIVRHSECGGIGLFPDRDKMTVGYKGIFNAITEINHSGFCQRTGLDAVRIIGAPSLEVLASGDFFYDALVRVPDYIAGALSRLDYHTKVLTSEQGKHKDLVQRFASDNPNLVIIQMSESVFSLGASTIRLSTELDRFPPVSCDELLEYVLNKARGFKRPQPRTYRQELLDHSSNWPLFSRMLRSLLKGVAAGDRGNIALFDGKTELLRKRNLDIRLLPPNGRKSGLDGKYSV